MSTVAPYLYEGTEIRTIVEGDVILFVAADVARVLGYSDAHNLTRRLDDEDRGTRSVSTPSGDQDMTVITEPGLYAAVLGSQVSGAQAFKRWVTHEVLPSIRRTGSYSAAYRLPQSYAEALRALAESVEERERISAELAEVTPRAEAFDHFLSGDRDYSVGAAAKLLVAEGYVTGERRLFAELDERGWLFRREGHWHLRQHVVDASGRRWSRALRLVDGSWYRTAWFLSPHSAMTYSGVIVEMHDDLGEWYWSDWDQIIEDYEAQP